MKKQIIIIAVISLAILSIPQEAKLSIDQDFCEEQGYTYSDGICIFDDENSCFAVEFYGGMCGEEYIKKLTCKKEGEQKTVATYCCSGLDGLYYYNIDGSNECQRVNEYNATCSNCGNGICETWENFCNCRSDCKKAGDEELIDKMRGKILLQVEEKGEAYYVNPVDRQRYYMGDGDSAYGIMRTLSLGITNNNLEKIPIGILDDIEIDDSDGDGLDDKLEQAIGTNQDNVDSDADSHSDKDEVINGFNPLGSGRLNYDNSLVERLKGRMLLQVESHGQVWYVNPNDGKRYYLKDGPTSYQMMSKFGLGITNENLFPINRGGIYLPFHDKVNTIAVDDNFTVSIPLGWSYKMPAPFGQDIEIYNAHEREGRLGDSYGQNFGNQLWINFEYTKFGESEFANNLLQKTIDRITSCDIGEGGTIKIDSLDFYQCNSDYAGYEAYRLIGDEYFFVNAYFFSKTEAIEDVEKILSTIDFIE